MTLLLLAVGASALFAQTEKQIEVGRYTPPPYRTQWYLSAGIGTPLLFGDVFSTNEATTHWGKGINLGVGYSFNNFFGLELKANAGMMKGVSKKYSDDFVLGSNHMTYYPYTIIRGNDYSTATEIIGIWGENIDDKMETLRYKNLYVISKYVQLSLHGVINLNRLFFDMDPTKEYFINPLLKPGIWVQKFFAQTYDRTSGKAFSLSVVTPISIGVGGDLALKFNFSKRLAAELATNIIWVARQDFDGINTIKMSHDDYIWNAGMVNLIYKFKPHIYPDPIVEKEPDITVPVIPLKDFEFTFATPSLSARKNRVLKDRARIQFHINKWDLIPNLGQNQVYLYKMASNFMELSRDEDISIDSITIVGYASPEGPRDFNKLLGEKHTLYPNISF